MSDVKLYYLTVIFHPIYFLFQIARRFQTIQCNFTRVIDEISWFYRQPVEYKREFLRYAWDWVKKTDPAGHLQMPSSRVVTLPAPGRRQIVCRVVPPSEDIPYGMDIDSTIIDIWNSDK